MSAPELVARCFAARTAAHFMHLQTASYAAHVALNEFYDAIIPATDDFIECYQGVYGKVDEYPAVKVATGLPVPMLRVLREWVVDNREECCESHDEDAEHAEGDDPDCTELANLIDNILAVIDRALYKLKFLG